MQTWQPKQHIVRNIAAEGRRQLVHGRHHLAHGRQQVATGIARSCRQLSEGSAHAAHWLSERAHAAESWHVHFEHGQAQALQVASAVALMAGCATSQAEDPTIGGDAAATMGGEDAVTLRSDLTEGGADQADDAPGPELGWWWTDPTLSGGEPEPQTARKRAAARDTQPPPGGVTEAGPRANDDMASAGGASGPARGGGSTVEAGESTPLEPTAPASSVFSEPAGGESLTGPWYSTGF